MEIRLATQEDLDAITTITIEAFPDDPQWDYRFPRSKEFPEDTFVFTKLFLKSMLDAPYEFIIMVACCGSIEDINMVRPIAVAVFETENLPPASRPNVEPPSVKTMEPTQSSDELRERRDMNPAHMNAFLSALVTGKKKYFQDVYGPNFMHLRILGTLPAYRGRKAGSTLVRWGLDLARTHGMPTSLFASPMGGVVYKHLGFKPVGELVVQAEGEEEKLFYDAMVYEFEK